MFDFPDVSPPADDENPKWFCTFCWKECKNKYDWARHEETHIENANKWICMPDDTPLMDNMCVFCTEIVSLSSITATSCHSERHNVKSCLEATLAARTFGRKDLLREHIKRNHLDERTRGSMEVQRLLEHTIPSWHREGLASELPENALWCGFCQKDCHSWKIRQEHVASHFQKRPSFRGWKMRNSGNISSGLPGSTSHVHNDKTFSLQGRPDSSQWGSITFDGNRTSLKDPDTPQSASIFWPQYCLNSAIYHPQGSNLVDQSS